MKPPLALLRDKFQKAILAAYPQAADAPVEITESTQEKFGHYQCNSAMKLTKIAGQNPRKIAEEIVAKFDRGDAISALEIAGPGFINVTLTTDYISRSATAMASEPHLAIDLPAKKERVIVEFSSPNIAKELHVGHLRSTIIGDCLARLFEFLGHDVLRLNHVGDWGTSFGMLIAYMKQNFPDVLTGKQETDLTHLVGWYKASKKQFDEDLAFKKASQLEVVLLQGGNPESLKAWHVICDISRKAYQEIYDLLDVHLNERGESYYNPMLAPVIEELKQKGLVKISDGATCLFPEGFQSREGTELPLMLQKSDGGYTYDTTDMAAIKHRIEVEKADRIIVVVDVGQSTHFQMVFKAAEMAGWLNPKKVFVTHVPFGLVLGADGKKFRTRSGDTEKLIDLLNEAIDHADTLLQARSPEMDLAERKKLAHALGISAVKYADLSNHRLSDYTFSYDRMLKFEGNTAAFLMYAYVRIAGIKRKVNAGPQKEPISLKHPSEIALGLHLIRFSEALDQITKDLAPNRLTEYLFNLAEKFNAFYRDCKVEGTPEQNSRLLLCEAVAKTLQQGLHILGVETVEKM
jgi:arginyl-tRNA synthetase